MHKEVFDVIIIGGGPAGLSIASELSGGCRVLVIEKGVAGTTEELDRFIKMFRIIDPILCEKVFTLKLSQGELAEMLPVVLEEFTLAELCRIVPAVGFKNLLLEAGYCLEDLLFDSIRDLFGFGPAKETDDGFDFDAVADCPNS